jgi:hypothetical protein
MNQLVGLADDYTKFEQQGAQIIALAVQPQNAAAATVEGSKAQFPILADSEHAVADEYGVYDLFQDSEAAASVFIISQDGRIVWDHIATRQTERVPSQTILENLPGAEEEKSELPAAEAETLPKVSVTLRSTVHSSDLGGYAWLQEFLSSNDFEAADAKFWSESARAGAVCYASVAPASKSAPSAVDGSFSITFEAEPGSTFRIMCDPDETHPGALGIDVFTVPIAGGTIDHTAAGFLYPGLLTPELGVANELAAQAAGYADAEEMFQSAGTCRVLALPGEGATIAVSDGDAYGFYMEAPDTAGRVTMLTDPAGAYIVIKEFEVGDSEAEIDIDFTDISGAGLTWPTAVCPIKKGFSTHLEILPE